VRFGSCAAGARRGAAACGALVDEGETLVAEAVNGVAAPATASTPTATAAPVRLAVAQGAEQLPDRH
jgi:hypothetical protein